MGNAKGKGNGIRKVVHVETSELQARLPELLLCVMDGETVIITHRGNRIAYITQPDEERERELRKEAFDRFREERRKMPKTGMTTEEALELVRHPLD